MYEKRPFRQKLETASLSTEQLQQKLIKIQGDLSSDFTMRGLILQQFFRH